MNTPQDNPPSRFEASADGASWKFRGTLDFDNVVEVLAAADALPLPAEGHVDLAGMEKGDSAALALLFALQRRARTERRKLAFVGLPPGLEALARVYGIDELLVGA